MKSVNKNAQHLATMMHNYQSFFFFLKESPVLWKAIHKKGYGNNIIM